MPSSGPTLDRDLFAVTRHAAYLNHARHAPLPQPAVDAVAAFLHDAAVEASAAWERWDTRSSAVRRQGAAFFGAPPDDVGFVKNTTEALAIIASGLGLGAGQRVVVSAHEFASNLLVWQALAAIGAMIDVRTPEDPDTGLTLDEWRAALAEPAAVVAVSWVQSSTGYRTDLAALAELAHRAGAVLVVDAIQGLGMIPGEFPEWGVDAAAAAGFKHLLAPEGIGLAYLAPSLRERLRPLQPGWYSEMHTGPPPPLDDTPKPTLAYTEGGSPNSLGIAALGASADLLLDAGVGQTWRYVDGLGVRLGDALSATGAVMRGNRSPEARSSIAVFNLPGHDPVQVNDALAEAGVVCSARPRGVRVSPHGYNTEDEIDLLVDVVASLAG